jgi:hypothetical protein
LASRGYHPHSGFTGNVFHVWTAHAYFALNMTGNRYRSMPPMIQMMSIKLEITAPPSIIAERSVAPKLSNSWWPDSVRRRLRRFRTQTWSQMTIGMSARAMIRLYSLLSINNRPLFKVLPR